MTNATNEVAQGAMESLGIDPELAARLVCPVDRGVLDVQGETLVCTSCGRSYPVCGGIPEMIAGDVASGT